MTKTRRRKVVKLYLDQAEAILSFFDPRVSLLDTAQWRAYCELDTLVRNRNQEVTEDLLPAEPVLGSEYEQAPADPTVNPATPPWTDEEILLLTEAGLGCAGEDGP